MADLPEISIPQSIGNLSSLKCGDIVTTNHIKTMTGKSSMEEHVSLASQLYELYEKQKQVPAVNTRKKSMPDGRDPEVFPFVFQFSSPKCVVSTNNIAVYKALALSGLARKYINDAIHAKGTESSLKFILNAGFMFSSAEQSLSGYPNIPPCTETPVCPELLCAWKTLCDSWCRITHTLIQKRPGVKNRETLNTLAQNVVAIDKINPTLGSLKNIFRKELNVYTEKIRKIAVDEILCILSVELALLGKKLMTEDTLFVPPWTDSVLKDVLVEADVVYSFLIKEYGMRINVHDMEYIQRAADAIKKIMTPCSRLPGVFEVLASGSQKAHPQEPVFSMSYKKGQEAKTALDATVSSFVFSFLTIQAD